MVFYHRYSGDRKEFFRLFKKHKGRSVFAILTYRKRAKRKRGKQDERQRAENYGQFTCQIV